MTVAVENRTRPPYSEVLPNLTQAAAWMEVAPSSVKRAVDRLGVKTLDWGRVRYLDVPGLLDVAREMRRFSPEEIAGDLLDYVEATAQTHRVAVQEEVDRYFATRPRREPSAPEAFVADLYSALPTEYATQAEEIYRRHALSTQ
jgi:hypothetical protein